MVSVVLPVFNEVRNGYLGKIIECFSSTEGFELLAIDGGSRDSTASILRDGGFRVIDCPNSTRAARLTKGILEARGEVVLLHHPRSVLDPKALNWIVNSYSQRVWGGFTHRFDREHWLLKFTSWYSNRIRSKRGILYLDHCLFFPKRAIPNPNSIPNVEIFEDTEISLILKENVGTPIVVPYFSTTSAVRFVENGILKQAILNQKMKLKYFLGYSDKSMNRSYEKGLNLNNH